jgi:threonine/homoserine efflux transporter RhtA
VTVTYLMPIWATLLGVLVLGETLSLNEPLGAAVVLFGVAISEGLLWRGRRMDPALEGTPMDSIGPGETDPRDRG